MKIYTYFDDSTGFGSQDELINLWRLSWSRRGWEPCILGPADAKRHPRFNEFNDRITTYPTANNRAYENACYHRWLALHGAGGGWMSDYDMINFAFFPQVRTRAFEIPEQAYVPCIAWLAPGSCRAIDIIMAYGPVPKWPANCQPEKNHISDMLVFQNRLQAELDLGDPDQAVAREFGEEEWRRFPLTHFSHSRTVAAGFHSKVEAIQKCGRPL